MKINFKKSKIHGTGVFALSNIKINEIIEIYPIILLSKKDIKKIDETLLYDYYFNWDNGQYAICLGYGSLYNHSYKPNAVYCKINTKNNIIFKAIKDIKKGQEITVNYNCDPDDKSKVWFEK